MIYCETPLARFWNSMCKVTHDGLICVIQSFLSPQFSVVHPWVHPEVENFVCFICHICLQLMCVSSMLIVNEMYTFIYNWHYLSRLYLRIIANKIYGPVSLWILPSFLWLLLIGRIWSLLLVSWV